MTIATLLLELKKMLDSEMEFFKLKNKNNNPNPDSKSEFSIVTNWDNYQAPNIYIGYRPISYNNKDLPSIIIVPPSSVVEELLTKTCDISFLITIKHENKDHEKNAVLAALNFVERFKDILFRNKVVGSYLLNMNKVEWGIDMLVNSADITIAEINCEYTSKNTYGEIL